MKKSRNRNRILRKLIKIAAAKPLIRHSHHAAGVVLDGKIISIGWAQYKTHPRMLEFQDRTERVYLHAEIDAINKAISKYGTSLLSEADLYVVRLSKGKTIGNSKPCEGCQKAIDAFGIKNVVWSEREIDE